MYTTEQQANNLQNGGILATFHQSKDGVAFYKDGVRVDTHNNPQDLEKMHDVYDNTVGPLSRSLKNLTQTRDIILMADHNVTQKNNENKDKKSDQNYDINRLLSQIEQIAQTADTGMPISSTAISGLYGRGVPDKIVDDLIARHLGIKQFSFAEKKYGDELSFEGTHNAYESARNAAKQYYAGIINHSRTPDLASSINNTNSLNISQQVSSDPMVQTAKYNYVSAAETVGEVPVNIHNKRKETKNNSSGDSKKSIEITATKTENIDTTKLQAKNTLDRI